MWSKGRWDGRQRRRERRIRAENESRGKSSRRRRLFGCVAQAQVSRESVCAMFQPSRTYRSAPVNDSNPPSSGCPQSSSIMTSDLFCSAVTRPSNKPQYVGIGSPPPLGKLT